jgi:endonuclease/exonuclease/phosphatase (EEP) superfamily protein YafD
MSDTSSATADVHYGPIIFWSIVYALMLIPLLLFVASLLGRYFYLCELVGNFRAYILAMLVPCALILWLKGKRKRALLFAGASLWSCFGVITPALPYSQPPPGVDIVKIMSFNVWAINRDYQSVIDRVKEHDPDVVTVLEYANDWETALRTLNKTYPYRLRQPRWHGFGIAIFSKRPISNASATQITADITDNPLLSVDIEIGGRPVRLAGLHLLSPMNRNRLKIRNRQLAEIADILIQRDIPTIVMGDFNCTPWSPFLYDFCQRVDLRDSRNGFGYQASWNAERPYLSIPIDHAFVSPQFHVHSRMLGDFAGSDHYPLVFEVSLKAND